MGLRKKPKGPKDPSKIKPKKQKKVKLKGHLIKQMQKMESEAGKGKKLSVPPVRSRQGLITTTFESQLDGIGLQASASSGYVPVSHTPLARFLKDRNVAEDTVSAVIAGIMEEETQDDVKAIIIAASPELGLVGDELENAIDLAIEEWRNVKKISET